MEDIRIYIAEQKGEIKIEEGLIRSTLNYDTYQSPYRNPLGRLRHVNEWRGVSGQVFVLPKTVSHIAVFLPLSGGILVHVDGVEYAVPVGCVSVLPIRAEQVVMVSQQVSADDYFIFQHFMFSIQDITGIGQGCYTLPVIDPANQNLLMPVLTDSDTVFQLYMGAFIGKMDFRLMPNADFQHMLALTLEGNFEVEERMLFEGDALYLPDFRKLDVECLSALGVLLVIHF